MKTQTQQPPRIETEVKLDPNERVPIMIEITAKDLAKAGPFQYSGSCLVCTALRRLGHKIHGAGGSYVRFENGSFWGHKYFSEDITSSKLMVEGRSYSPEVVGKQIILYPE